ncbi:hypothetical protein KKE60_07115 [Patescibacteria group bacterium]|nr:hypothetical protein [Patescibacteria group bacterium]
MDKENILNLKVGGKKQIGVIQDIETGIVPDKHGADLPKLTLIVKTETNVFNVDEAFVYTKDDEVKPQGFWIKLDSDGQLNAASTLAKTLKYLEADTINDLIGKNVELYPKPNGYLALIAIDESEKLE